MAMRERDLEMDVFFDGACQTCVQQVELLRESEKNECIHLVDISAHGFDVERDAGIPIDRATDCIQARLESGEVVQGAVALRLLREAASRKIDFDVGRDEEPDGEFLECRKAAGQITHSRKKARRSARRRV